jgi:hypothetical protein
MQAKVGDELTAKGLLQRDAERHGEIVDIIGIDGAPPYLVRWLDGHESVFFASEDTVVEHRPASKRAKRGAST